MRSRYCQKCLPQRQAATVRLGTFARGARDISVTELRLCNKHANELLQDGSKFTAVLSRLAVKELPLA